MLLRVREFRRKAGLSQAALASGACCSRELISAIETDRTCPKVNLLERIAAVLHVPVWTLFPDNEDDTPTPKARAL